MVRSVTATGRQPVKSASVVPVSGLKLTDCAGVGSGVGSAVGVGVGVADDDADDAPAPQPANRASASSSEVIFCRFFIRKFPE